MLKEKVLMMGATVFKSFSGGDPWEALVSFDRAKLIFDRCASKNDPRETFKVRLRRMMVENSSGMLNDPKGRKASFGVASLQTGAVLYYRRGKFFVSGYANGGSDVRKALEA